MTQKPRLISVLTALTCLWLPALATAQSQLAGVVKDASGGVLPGVLVEASSPVLIEGTKSATTDEPGSFPDHRSPAWRVHGDFHADRLPGDQARQDSGARRSHRGGQRELKLAPCPKS